MKFCKDCVHYKLLTPTSSPELGLCSRTTANQDPVTGTFEGDIQHLFCRVERVTNTGNCGREARFFQPKEVPLV